MKKQSISGLLLLAVALAVPAFAAGKPANKAAVKVTAAAPAKPVEPELLAPAALSPQQMAIASNVLVGKINCELAVVVTMTNDERSPGRFFLDMGSKHYVLLPVVTSTGAVRLEEEASGAVWLQLGNKSMLMNQKEGKRLADECMNPDQLLVAQAMERNPQPGLLDAPKDALVPIGAGGAVQELVPNPDPAPKLIAKAKTKKKSK
ncbi:hypothetical protein [Candidatus Aalborgicola defluviihabitans]|uniref:hypothetical protein n=1 Tax=Candidatus Aalborgicola defluviihabitans TaxID=3386187 RepID=UPI001D874F51|nr:hypothetical protein [Burkholderiales bacterium]